MESLICSGCCFESDVNCFLISFTITTQGKKKFLSLCKYGSAQSCICWNSGSHVFLCRPVANSSRLAA